MDNKATRLLALLVALIMLIGALTFGALSIIKLFAMEMELQHASAFFQDTVEKSSPLHRRP